MHIEIPKSNHDSPPNSNISYSKNKPNEPRRHSLKIKSKTKENLEITNLLYDGIAQTPKLKEPIIFNNIKSRFTKQQQQALNKSIELYTPKRNKSGDKKHICQDGRKSGRSLKNYILKSDYCKSLRKAGENQLNNKRLLNPGIQYYGDMNKNRNSSRGSSLHGGTWKEEDKYSGFVTRPEAKSEANSYSANYFIEHPQVKKKEIMINTYEEEEEDTMEFVRSPTENETKREEVQYYNMGGKKSQNVEVESTCKFDTGVTRQIEDSKNMKSKASQRGNPNVMFTNYGRDRNYMKGNPEYTPPEFGREGYGSNIATNGNVNNYNYMMMVNQYHPLQQQRMKHQSNQVNVGKVPSKSPKKYNDVTNNHINTVSFTSNSSMSYPSAIQGVHPHNAINQSNMSMNMNMNMNVKEWISPLNSNYSTYTDESLAQLSPFIIKEQLGCRFIQDKILADPKFANDGLFPSLINDLFKLINDPFGNYLFQVLIDKISTANLQLLLKLLSQNFGAVCLNQHGTRVIQKIIEVGPYHPNLIDTFFQLFQPNILQITKDIYGNHIIPKYLAMFPYPRNALVYEVIHRNFLEIANSKHGCCVIQKCLTEGTPEQLKETLKHIEKNLYGGIRDQYGNYIIQYLFNANNSKNLDLTDIVALVKENIVVLCKQKYSSNVLEKGFETAEGAIQQCLLEKLLSNDNIIRDIITDSHGNYVIQKAGTVAKGDVYVKMLTIIAGSISRIKKQSFGSKGISKGLGQHHEGGDMIVKCKERNKSEKGKNYGH